MNAFGLIPKARTASPLAAALLLTAAFALAPERARAETSEPGDAAFSVEDEVRFEQTCEDWQKARPCQTAAGEVRHECVARSPLAKFWAMLGDRPEDDEVRVEVIRKAPDGAQETTEAAQAHTAGRTASAAGRQEHTKKIVRVKQGEKLPVCRSDG